MSDNPLSEGSISGLANDLLLAELEAIRKEQINATNGWRLVMLVQMPTFCGIVVWANKSLTLLLLLGIVAFTLYIAEYQRMLNNRSMRKYRDKIIHDLSDNEMDKFISTSYDYRFYKMASPLSSLISRLDLIWLSLSTAICLITIHFIKFA